MKYTSSTRSMIISFVFVVALPFLSFAETNVQLVYPVDGQKLYTPQIVLYGNIITDTENVDIYINNHTCPVSEKNDFFYCNRFDLNKGINTIKIESHDSKQQKIIKKIEIYAEFDAKTKYIDIIPYPTYDDWDIKVYDYPSKFIKESKVECKTHENVSINKIDERHYVIKPKEIGVYNCVYSALDSNGLSYSRVFFVERTKPWPPDFHEAFEKIINEINEYYAMLSLKYGAETARQMTLVKALTIPSITSAELAGCYLSVEYKYKISAVFEFSCNCNQ